MADQVSGDQFARFHDHLRRAEQVEGGIHRGSDGEAELTVGTDGVTGTCGDAVATVAYDRSAALLVWPDGARQLIGDVGITVHVEPNLFEPVPDLAVVDDAVPWDRHVAMPARPGELIPSPPPVVGRFTRLVRSVREGANTATWLSATLIDPER